MAAVNSASTNRNYLDMLNGTESTAKKYNAVFGDSKSDLSVSDFFQLMVTQLTNQDFMNPVDDTQYLAQMAQFATMQEMMDLCQYSKQNYVMGMLGQNVSLTKNEIGGDKKEITGKVDKIVLENNDYKIYINGSPYDYNKVTSIISSSVSSNDKNENDEKDEIKTDAKA